jgi:hypothetical protein
MVRSIFVDRISPDALVLVRFCQGIEKGFFSAVHQSPLTIFAGE